MEQFSPKPNSCSNCSLKTLGQGFIQPEGIGSIPLLLVGESPGYNEILDSLPFRPQAQAGSMLHRIMQRARIERNTLALSNLIQCRPPQDHLQGAHYEYSSINHCRIHFDNVILKYNPKVILALGALPFKHLTGKEGYKLNISTIRGYIFRCTRYPNILVIGTYHPSYLIRGNVHLMGVFMNDLVRATWLAQGKLKEGIDYDLDPINNNPKYNTNPTQEDALHFLKEVKENPNLLISYDIETDKSVGEEEDEIEGGFEDKITQIQFSADTDSGIAFPFTEPFISISKAILASPNPKCGHNIIDFDNPHLYRADFTINGQIDDSMWMQHHYEADLPLGLQYVASRLNFKFPWKHLSGSNLPFYGVADVTSVQYIMKNLPPKLKQRLMWDSYVKFVRNFKPILESISIRGLPINREKQDKFDKEIEKRKEEILIELKEYIPDSLEKFNKKDGYKRVPKEVEEAKLKWYIEQGTTAIEPSEEYILEQTGYVKRDFLIITTKSTKKTKQQLELEKMGVVFTNGIEVHEPVRHNETRYVKLVDFNPNSPDQISNYIKSIGHEELANKLKVVIKKELDLEPGKEKKNNVPTNKTLLSKLATKTGNKAYKLIVEYKELSKMKGTYIDGYRDHLDSNNRIHTLYTMRPASGQLSSRSPNVQNYPMHTSLANSFKECIEASEGRIFVCFDYRGFFNKMMGFLSKDEVYLRLAALDTHSYVTGHFVQYPGIDTCLDLNDIELEKYLKEIKSKHEFLRDNQVKRTVHGINNGLTPEGCYKRFGDDFNPTPESILVGRRKQPAPEQLVKLIEKAGKDRVKKMYSILKQLFPKVFEWQDSVIIEADKMGFLQTPFGARRWFFAATKVQYDKFGKASVVKRGDQADEALAYPTSCYSHYYMRESMIELNKQEIDKKFWLVNQLHDQLTFEPLESEVLDCINSVKPIMEHKCSVLKNELMETGFWCQVDVKVGKSMAILKEYKI